MKKTLTVAIVTVCLICLAITGTMAIYNKTIDVNEGGNDVTAKTFYIGTTETAFANSEIAPGETVTWDFGVTNTGDNGKTSGVNMDMAISLILNSTITNLEVSIIEVSGTTVVESIKGLSNSTYTLEDAFTAKNSLVRKYQVVIHWPAANDSVANEEDTNDSENGTATIQVKVTGTQSLKK